MNELTTQTNDTTLTVANQLELANHPVFVYLGSLTSDNSRRAMSNGLRTLLSVVNSANPSHDVYAFPFWQLDYQHVTALRSRMIELAFSPAKINLALSALRGVVKHAWKLGLIDAERRARIDEIENVKQTTLDASAGRQVKPDEIQSLLLDCDDTTIEGARDKAIIVLGLRAGLRRSEIAALELRDYNRNTGRITVNEGKGKKSRTVYLANNPKAIVDAWIDVRGSKPGKLFGRIIRNQSDLDGLTGQTVMNILSKHANGAALTEPITPHDMRRTFVGDALDAGIDLATVADLAGHSSTDTTRRYDRRGERRKSDAAQKLDV